MKPPTDLKKWLQQSRKNWLVLAQAALWLGGILGGFLLPPPVGVSSGDEKIWLKFGQFIVAVVLGLVFFAVSRWNRPRHSLKWCGVTVLFLALAVAAFFRYQQLTLAWTGVYEGQKVVTGSVFTPQGLAYTTANPRLSLNELISDFTGVTENLWTRESINRRRLLLATTYVSCLPLFTICLIAVVQAVQCGAGQKNRRKIVRTVRPTR